MTYPHPADLEGCLRRLYTLLAICETIPGGFPLNPALQRFWCTHRATLEAVASRLYGFAGLLHESYLPDLLGQAEELEELVWDEELVTMELALELLSEESWYRPPVHYTQGAALIQEIPTFLHDRDQLLARCASTYAHIVHEAIVTACGNRAEFLRLNGLAHREKLAPLEQLREAVDLLCRWIPSSPSADQLLARALREFLDSPHVRASAEQHEGYRDVVEELGR